MAGAFAAGLVGNQADDLTATRGQLANPARTNAAKSAGARNQHSAQANASQPAPLKRLTNELARQIPERDVAEQEDAPHRARDLEGPDVALGLGRVVRLEVQRRDNAEDDGKDAADQHVEEVVDARAAAAEP